MKRYLVLLKTVFKENVDDLRYVYSDESGRGPEVEDMISFLSHCPELKRRRHTKTLFKMCCLCFNHWSIDLPYVEFVSANPKVVTPNLSSVVRPLQCSLLLLSQDCSILHHEESIGQCRELLEPFGEIALLLNYDPWGFVDFNGREIIYAALAERCKNVRGKSDQVVSVTVLTAFDVLSKQNQRPVQRRRIDVDKTSKVACSRNLVSIRKCKSTGIDKAGCSKA